MNAQKQLRSVRFKDWDCYAWVSAYSMHPDTPAIVLRNMKDMSAVAKATIWLPELAPGEVAIKSYSENEGMEDALLKAKVIGPRLREIQTGFTTVSVHRLFYDQQKP